ncbi:MAG: hypothetical protein O3A01_03365 [bacterium]|nr:hypothetical protein [bacterium]
MIYDVIIKLLKKNFYILGKERFKSTLNNRILERYTAKHPLLTPELIVVNDQPYGFRRQSRSNKSLERFPIYCEIEYFYHDEEDMQFLESIDLYSEIKISVQNKLNTLKTLAKKFEEFVLVERIKRVGVDDESAILIYSKISQYLLEQFYDDEVDEDFIDEETLEAELARYLIGFSNFIKVTDEIFIKGKKIDQLDPDLLP